MTTSTRASIVIALSVVAALAFGVWVGMGERPTPPPPGYNHQTTMPAPPCRDKDGWIDPAPIEGYYATADNGDLTATKPAPARRVEIQGRINYACAWGQPMKRIEMNVASCGGCPFAEEFWDFELRCNHPKSQAGKPRAMPKAIIDDANHIGWYIAVPMRKSIPPGCPLPDAPPRRLSHSSWQAASL